MAGERILLADDNKLVVRITSAILEGAGYSVEVAWNGLEAINKAYTENPDIIILDVEMPKVSGLQVLRLLRDDEYTRDIPVVMLTGRDRPSDMFWGIKTGADAYMTKGFKPEELLEVVEQKLREGNKRKGKRDEVEVPKAELEEEWVLSRVVDLLDSKLFESTLLNELGSLASAGHDYRKTLGKVLEIVAGVAGNAVGGILMIGEENVVIDVEAPVASKVVEELKGRLLGLVVDYGFEPLNPERVEITIFGGINIKEDEALESTPYSFVYAPLSSQKKVIGLAMLAQRESPVFVRETQGIFNMLENQMSIVVDNARLYEAARQLAITDGLTRIYNHRFFQEMFEKEYKRSDRYNTVFSLIMLDIDHFKRINDTYGHLCGDEILKGLANVVKSCLRSMDILARYGGEEFVILLPETSGEEAFEAAERIRETVENHVFVGGENGLHITVSQGVATYPSPGIHDRYDILEKADRALYEAKESGRNKTVFKD